MAAHLLLERNITVIPYPFKNTDVNDTGKVACFYNARPGNRDKYIYTSTFLSIFDMNKLTPEVLNDTNTEETEVNSDTSKSTRVLTTNNFFHFRCISEKNLKEHPFLLNPF